MRWLIAIVALLAFAGATVQPASAASPDGWHPCEGNSKVLCGTVVAPLDPSGVRPGTVRLHAEMLSTPRRKGGPPPRKALFLVAGGPGQASAAEFDLVSSGAAFQSLFPGYALVAYDDRGTGRSGALNCSKAATIAACGRQLGARRVFYSTRANVADTDAVRRSLGFDRISILGVSYGTAQALAYAATYPSHVARLVLDSVAIPSSSDVFALDTIRAVSGSLEALCRDGACRDVTNDPAGDLSRLANALQAKPLVASIAVAPSGKKQKVRIDGLALLLLAIETDLNPGVAAELPAAVSAALAGRPRPLVRLFALTRAWHAGGTLGVNSAVGVSTNCADGVFPWSSDTPVADRGAILDSAVSALPKAATAPFGNWAAMVGNAAACKNWPASSAETAVPSGPLPNVPVLILAGSRDTRTPLVNAQAIARQFPRSRLLVVSGAGHSLIGSSTCAIFFTVDWLAGKRHTSCPRQAPLLAPIGPFASGSDRKPGALTPAQTFFAAKATLEEAEATWLTTLGSRQKLSGLLGGTLTPKSEDGFRFSRYSAVAGVWLTGGISFELFGSKHWSGYMTVKGPRAAHGVLSVEDGRLAGSLAGEHVSGRTAPVTT